MVLRFRLISNEQDDFIRDFEILESQTFFDLHMAIQDDLHYDKTQIASFFICDRDWNQEEEITLFELSEEGQAANITMDNAVLGDYMHRVKDRMIYVFDVFNERMFFIELTGKEKVNPGLEYPRCSHREGNAPRQLLMENLFGRPDLTDSAIIDDTAFGEDFMGPDDTDGTDLIPPAYEDDLPDER
jgi:hypothetical protein